MKITHETINERWRYNCEDCVRTREIGEVLSDTIRKMALEVPESIQHSMFDPVLTAMLRGVRIDLEVRSELSRTLLAEMRARETWFQTILGHSLNPQSPKQLQALFYGDFQFKPILKKGKDGFKPTLNEDALIQLSRREPLLLALVRRILEHRSLRVFRSTFVEAELDEDSRMRCSYNLCGTETFRLSSSANAFDKGTNLQNLPKGSKAKEVDDLELPNIRKMFIPDPGYTFFDGDLDRADLQVVVWEAGDEDLKKGLRLGLDMHCLNACSIFNIRGIPPDELAESHPNYREHRGKIGEDKRQKAKQGVHATNYGCKARTLSTHLGSTQHEADKFISAWLQAHPGIKRWQDSVERDLQTRRTVTNKYGYRRVYFDRVDGLLPEALAWIPQSTVALTINRIWRRIWDTLPDAQVLLQVHDSLAGQFPTGHGTYFRDALESASRACVIPYEDPLCIPFSVKTSEKSWGDCV